MKKKNRKTLALGVSLLLAFVLWTLLVCFVDVQTIGPQESSVGLATLNGYVHDLIGVNWLLYTVTDWLGLVPIAVVLGFAGVGLMQMIRRKGLWRVDCGILALGVFYIVVIAVYLFFETVVINYRPTLIDGHLEASYPSSTTMLVTCVMPTAALELKGYMKHPLLGRCTGIAIAVFTAFMLIGRLLSGVHWITDIIGGVLFSAGIVLIYSFVRSTTIRQC